MVRIPENAFLDIGREHGFERDGGYMIGFTGCNPLLDVKYYKALSLFFREFGVLL